MEDLTLNTAAAPTKLGLLGLLGLGLGISYVVQMLCRTHDPHYIFVPDP